MKLFILIVCLSYWKSVDGRCQDKNVALDGGQAFNTSASSSPTDCQRRCDSSNCQHWYWQNKQCSIMKLAKPGNKIGRVGSFHGVKTNKNSTNCLNQVTAITCHYVTTREPVLCLFPFIGQVPGDKTSNVQSDTCLKTKKGKQWCATKISIDNRLLATSDQRKDVECGIATTYEGSFRCLTPSLCPNVTSALKEMAELQTQNRELQRQLDNQSCNSNTKTNNNNRRPTNKPATTSNSGGSLGTSPNSCVGRCGKPAQLGSCQCNTVCGKFGDCCSDYSKVCPSAGPTTKAPPKSQNQGSRPSATASRTANGADPTLGAFTEKLFAMDANNVRRLIKINDGCTTRVGDPKDCSSSNLFTSVDTSIFRRPVYEKLMRMYENYVPETTTVEDHTNAEKAEEAAFLNEIINTDVMKETYDFLKKNKYFTGSISEFKNLLNELWFSVYSRGKRIKGSSGFEHVFLGEKKEGAVQGFHNWVYFYFLENKNKVNYLGHWKNVDFAGRANGLSFTFKWDTEQKPFGSMIVGTSPEFEMAVYTTCLLAKGEQKCPVSLGGKKVDVEVHIFTRPRGVKYVASAFFKY